MGLRFEVWTLPSAASFEKKFDVPEALAGSSGVRELSSYTNERLLVPSLWDDIDSVASETVSTWIKVFDGTTLIDEFRTMRVSKLAQRPSVRQISGPQRNGMVEWCGIYPYSETQPDWIFGGENLLTNPSFEDNTATPLIYHLYHDGTGGSFDITDGTDSTTVAFDDNRADVEAGLQTDITAITDVFVGGTGTESDPWVIEFNDPKFGVSLTVDDSSLTGGTATITQEQAGELTVSGWEPNQFVLSGFSDQPFGNPNTFEVSDEQASDGSKSVKIDQPEGFPPSGFAGIQQRVRVNPGGTYQAAGDFYPTDGDDTFYLTLRTLDNEHVDSSTGGITPGTLTPDQWNTEEIVDVTIPDHVSEIIFRYAQGGTGDANNDPALWYADNAVFTEGFAASTYTKILRLLIEAAQARGTFGFIELDATDGADSNGTSLSAISFTAYTGDNAHLGHVVDDGRAMGYHWRIVPASAANVITPAAGTTHVLQVFFDSEGEIEDLTSSSGGPSVTTGGQLEDAETVTRTPSFTTLELLGTGSLTLEDTDATLEANMGRIERVKDAEHLADTTSLQQLADGLFADQAFNLIAAKAIVLSTDQNRPGIDYVEGSKIWWQFPGILEKEARVVKRFGWTHGTTTRYDVQGSTVYTDETALARAVDRLLNQLRRRRRGAKPTPSTTGGAGSLGAYAHLNRDSVQSIAVSGEPISWTLLVPPPNGFSTLTVPTTEIEVDLTGYYDIAVQFGWDSFRGGGDIWIIRTRQGVETQVWPIDADPGSWSSTYGSVFDGTAPGIPLVAGDTIKVYVDHNDGSAQNLASATLALYLVDRADIFTSSNTYRETVLADGPVAYWRLDEPEGTSTATDETGNGHDGTYDADIDQGVDGLIANDPDRAAEFTDSADMAVTIPIHADLKFLDADYTLELWFKATDAQGSTKRLLSWQIDEWSIVAVSADGGNSCRFEGHRGGVQVASTGQLTAAAVGNTVHVVVTYDASSDEMKIYANGVEEGDGPSSGAITDGTDDVQIGRGGSISSTIPNAVLDEVAIYDKVLDSSQILNHYNVGSG